MIERGKRREDDREMKNERRCQREGKGDKMIKREKRREDDRERKRERR